MLGPLEVRILVVFFWYLQRVFLVRISEGTQDWRILEGWMSTKAEVLVCESFQSFLIRRFIMTKESVEKYPLQRSKEGSPVVEVYRFLEVLLVTIPTYGSTKEFKMACSLLPNSVDMA